MVVTRYVLWQVPLDRTLTPWTEIYGYEATDDRLRIGTKFGPDFAYDCDRVVGILDDHLPRL